MIQEVRITTIEQLMPLFFEQEWREDIHRNRGQYVYRGMRNIKFDLSTSLIRCCKNKQQALEPAILNNFAKYAVIEDPSIAQSVWRQMILGQHYGLPTRLLDWSHSALVGLHFATAEDDLSKMDQHDSMVWRIDMHELHELLPTPYREVMRDRTVFTVDMLARSPTASASTTRTWAIMPWSSSNRPPSMPGSSTSTPSSRSFPAAWPTWNVFLMKTQRTPSNT